MSALSQLSPDLVAMMVRGVSVNVASRDERMRPSTMRPLPKTTGPCWNDIWLRWNTR
jgi:hypothetical protein